MDGRPGRQHQPPVRGGAWWKSPGEGYWRVVLEQGEFVPEPVPLLRLIEVDEPQSRLFFLNWRKGASCIPGMWCVRASKCAYEC